MSSTRIMRHFVHRQLRRDTLATASPSQEEELVEAESIQQMTNEHSTSFALNEERKAAEVALEAEIQQMIIEYNTAFASNEERKAAEAAAAPEDTASPFQEEELMDPDIIEQMINDPHFQDFIDNDVSNLLFCYCYGHTDVIDETGYVAEDDSENELQLFTNNPSMNDNSVFPFTSSDGEDANGSSYWSLLNADSQWYLDDPSYWSLLSADHQWHLPSC